MMFLLENVADPNTLPESDTDNDGLSDRWELANGFDPFTPGEDSLDRDKDGLTNLEEYQNKLDPSSGDTDSDGVTDFAEANAEVDLTELVEIRLRTQDTGKVNNGANCAVCHTVQLRVGDISHFSVRPNATEKSFFLRKGTNYPIYLSDLMQSLGRPNQDTGTPGTSETYTAAILPPTNGTPRAYIFTDPQNRLGTNKVWTNSFPVNPTVPVGTVTVARIEVLWTNVPGNVPLEINPNKGVGLRVFPDRQHWTDGTARNVVRVRIKTTPPLPTGQRILLKSFDVDDPMYPIDPKDTSVDTNDVGTAKGDDNRGTPLAGQLASTVLTLNASGEAITNFTVTFQPGNNFRVAAVLDTPGAQAHLDGLQVTNANLPFYVAPDSSYPANFIGGISPMLTVWRKLHLEIDSMTAPLATGSETLFATGKVVGIKTNYPVAGRSQLSIRHQLIWADGLRQFEQGKVEITGIGTYRITDSATLSLVFNDWLTRLDIEGVPGGSVVGAGAKFYDDDDRYLTNDVLYPSILNLQSPPLPVNQRSAEIVAAIQPKYAPAYISIFDINQTNWNTVQTVPFKRHAEAERFGGPFNTGNQQLKEKDSPQFWAYTVVFGYQELPGEDGDPNGESLVQGDTVKHTFLQSPYSAVFMEAIRERQEWDNTPASNFTNTSGAITLRQDYNATWWRVTAHEIAHGPGGQSEAQDHAEDDIMKAGAPNFIQFSPATIKRFRSTSHWTWYP
jgi:hypothetical protein